MIVVFSSKQDELIDQLTSSNFKRENLVRVLIKSYACFTTKANLSIKNFEKKIPFV